MTSNAQSLIEYDFYDFPDWIEIYNGSSSSISLSGVYLSDERNRLMKYSFRASASIPANGYFIVYCDEQWIGNHTNFSLDSDGESIYLSYGGVIIDSVAYPGQYPDVSYGYDSKHSDWQYCIAPSPGNQNSISPAFMPAAISIYSKPAGRYSTIAGLNIVSPSGGVIRYTINGKVPTENSSSFINSISLNKTSVVKTRCYSDGYLTGQVNANTYFINEHTFTLPVVSLSANPEFLYDNTIGILVEGTNGTMGNCADLPSNWNQDWERSAYFEYFDKNGNRVINMPVGIKVVGGCSRTNPQKSIGILAHNKYADGNLNYPFFNDKPGNDNYKSLYLRNGGNDWHFTLFRDALVQTLAKEAGDIDYQSYQPVSVYINGKYTGLMNLREKVDEDYLFSNYGLDETEFDFLENGGSIIRGNNAEWFGLINFIENNSLIEENNYQVVASQIDIEEYINYMIIQSYVANRDWPGNNIKYWKSDNSKWRWIIFGTEYGLGLYNDPANHNTLHFITEANGPDWPNPPWSTLLIRKLLENKNFRNSFIQTFLVQMYSTFNPDHCTKIIDSMATVIENEMILSRPLYGKSIDEWYQSVNFVKNWLIDRYDFMPEYLRTFFQLDSSEFLISVNKTGEGKGKVKMNNVNLTHYPFTLKTYKNLPYKIEAIPDDGYRFSYWETSPFQTSETIIQHGSLWKYFDEATEYPANWTDQGLNDSLWLEGNAQLGYGDGDESTIISYGPDENNKISTALFRKTFSIDTTGIDSISLGILADDGAIVYMNSQEVFRLNITSGPVYFNTYALASQDNETGFYSFTINKSLLNNGTNTISAEVHQLNATSSDLSFDFKMSVTRIINKPVVFYSDNKIVEGTVAGSLSIKPIFVPALPVEGIFINEIATASVFLDDELGERTDFIELYNNNSQAVDVGGMFMTDNLSQPEKYKIPKDVPELTTIPANGFIVFFADGKEKQGKMHTGFSLNNDGEPVALIQKTGETYDITDSFTYDFLLPNYSYGRYKDGENSGYYMTTLTPGKPNTLEKYVHASLSEINSFNCILYPNPAKSKIFIKTSDVLPDQYQLFSVSITDMSSNTLISGVTLEHATHGISIETLKPGIYFLLLQNENFIVSAMKFIVIKD